LKGGNSSSCAKEQDNLNDLCNWIKSQNSKSRSRRFCAGSVPHVQPSNRSSVLEADQESTGLLKHVENRVKALAGKADRQKRKV
jgi:hypothetical protein